LRNVLDLFAAEPEEGEGNEDNTADGNPEESVNLLGLEEEVKDSTMPDDAADPALSKAWEDATVTAKNMEHLADRIAKFLAEEDLPTAMVTKFKKELDACSKEFNAVYKKIMDKEKASSGKARAFKLKTTFIDMVDNADRRIFAFFAKVEGLQKQAKEEDDLVSNSSSTSDMIDAIRAMQLPPLEIEPFDGMITRFREFMDE